MSMNLPFEENGAVSVNNWVVSGEQKQIQGFSPFDKLRVRMTNVNNYAPVGTFRGSICCFGFASTPYRYGPRRLSRTSASTMAAQRPASGMV
jgi:hypothetical protein